ncbi:inositol monophosphatase [Pleomorphomonas diazotrophica]|uniref:Inositol-1-monophosphatase n=1 Tax=Pleomorphomonas diazotrophica TaxID=1166257 RepID=A0A1I4UIC1_9HYPH|nr:inositol monophosphatase family protein [Pleomorphomonas diazotrophica]PKR89176.1 inositol monophosphatase [Pleomorphomonas diazotrophica]SFM88453.1 myo-inositol-1(or 4)-monophosphatase [Pleomorphomonas diazotrophica]
MPEIAAASPLLAAMIAAARLGGDLARRHFVASGQTRIDEKAARDYVTAADVAVEAAIATALGTAFPGWSIDGEEKAGNRDRGPDAPRFLIDPIDGTTNFAWGIPFFGVVISLLNGDRIDAGVVYDPMRDELFCAERGKGAFLDGVPLTVRIDRDIDHAVIGASLPIPGQVRSVPVDRYRAVLMEVMDHAAAMRRMGSAALSIAYVAAGRHDAFFEDGLSPHDYAASVLIVEEAGGLVSGFDGAAIPETGAVLAATPAVHPWLVERFTQ